MHYRETDGKQNPETRWWGTCSGNPVAGILHSVNANSTTCNGRVAPIGNNDPYVTVGELLHADDLPPQQATAA